MADALEEIPRIGEKVVIFADSVADIEVARGRIVVLNLDQDECIVELIDGRRQKLSVTELRYAFVEGIDQLGTDAWTYKPNRLGAS